MVRSTTMPVILLVHGAWHGPWNWVRVENDLTALGWQVRTVSLPSVVRTEGQRSGLHDDAEVIRQHIADIDGPVVIVAHSYGGAAVSEGAAGMPDVRHIIYLAAFLLDIGESILVACGGAPEWWNVKGDIVTPHRPQEVFYADLTPAGADWAAAHLKPQSLAAFTESQTAAAWKTVSSSYVICEQDRAIPLPAQEQMSARATRTRRLRSSHSPFLSMPRELTKLIADLVAAPHETSTRETSTDRRRRTHRTDAGRRTAQSRGVGTTG